MTLCLFALPEYSRDGCLTLWERGQNHITCSCDHLTYFSVLMVGLAFFIIRTIQRQSQQSNQFIQTVEEDLKLFSYNALFMVTIHKNITKTNHKIQIQIFCNRPFSQQTFLLVTLSTNVTRNTNNSQVASVQYDSMTVNQHPQYQEPDTAAPT